MQIRGFRHVAVADGAVTLARIAMAENAVIVVVGFPARSVSRRIGERTSQSHQLVRGGERIFVGFDRHDPFRRKRHLILIGEDMGLVLHMGTGQHEIDIGAAADRRENQEKIQAEPLHLPPALLIFASRC